MEVINQHTTDYTIARITLGPSSFSTYENSGNRKSIQWIYLVSGEIQIQYTKNAYNGYYNIVSGILADLRPIKDLKTTWITPPNTTSNCIAFMSADENLEHEAEVITIDDRASYDQQVDQDRIMLPLDSSITVNNTSISQSSCVRIPANKKISLQGYSRILVFTLSNE